MFWNRRKERAPNRMSELVHSPYSMLKPIGYQIPQNMIEQIESEMKQITRDSILHHLIDELTVDEMQSDNPDGIHFIDRILHHKFVKPLNELKRQKIVIEREMIGSIRMLQKAELMKHKRALDFARAEFERCELILTTGNNGKTSRYNKMNGGKGYE